MWSASAASWRLQTCKPSDLIRDCHVLSDPALVHRVRSHSHPVSVPDTIACAGCMVAYPGGTPRETKMARKPASRAEFVTFDVFYKDGSQRSNRRVPSSALGGLDLDAPALAILEEQDRLIAEKSGNPPLPIERIRRSASK